MPLSWRLMMRLRVLGLSRLRRALLSRLDSRYITKSDHRRDLKDALWEVQMLRREVVALRNEVDRLRRTGGAPVKATPEPRVTADPKAAEAYRLATETAEAVDTLLQNEMRIWQAIDDLSARMGAPTRAR
ncbi:hypothetical protein GCM10010116_10050 [Microbispora rosea subsp. aerata]|nr:hypothetical protein GCM10010116_10050 [Microbispora rosea subsp. aerata]GIH56217.1 hypothetical protein Mro02_31310 [Microbispora rosea subsp. aerata]GLJ82343.1 hypothetical protein GCM10017588_10680 [Microbispora rosea subsp. aerata]